MSDKLRDIVISKGDIIENLKVVSDVYYKEIGKLHKRRRYFNVICLKCNNKTEVSELSLKKHKTGICKHCRNNVGRMKGNPQNHNTYDLSGEYGIGYTNKNQKFYFDLEDYDLIKNYTWYINANGYVETQRNKNKILMHRLLINASDKDNVDHKNRLRNCNLKSNLNIVTKKENNQNNSIYKNNSSGTTGVSFDKKNNAWRAYININGSRIYGGLFSNINDAIKRRMDLEKKYFEYLQSIK